MSTSVYFVCLYQQIYIPWHPTRKMEQIDMTSKAMAYIHLSAKMAIERQYCHQKEPLRFYSPLTFMEFVHIFRIISAYIVKLELVCILLGKGAKLIEWFKDLTMVILLKFCTTSYLTVQTQI